MSSQLKKQKKTIKKVTKLVNKLPKKVNKIRGRGGYFSDALDWGKKAWSNLNENEREGASNFNKVANKIGNAIGSEFGIGKQLGNAGSWLSRVFGMGKYTIKRNTLLHPSGENLVQGMDTQSPPSFSTSGRGSDIIFSHREYVADVLSSINFRTTTYPINPGNPSLFPWMSQIASLYEEFEMLGMILEYKSSSGTSNTSAVPGMGLVLMATDYDPYDTTFNSKRQMEAAEFSSSGVPYSNFMHPIECDPKRNVLRTQYVVPGITNYTQASGDARFSVLGNTTIATIGQQADNVTMGELWVTYHVRLSRPILETAAQIFNQHIKTDLLMTGFLGTVTTFTTAGAVPFGVSTTGTGTSLRLVIDNTNNQLQGRFRVTYMYIGAGTPSLNVPAVHSSVPPGISNLGLTNLGHNDLRGDTFGFLLSRESDSGLSSGLYEFNTISTSVVDIPLLSYNTVVSLDIFIERVDHNLATPQILSRNELKALSTKSAIREAKISKDEVDSDNKGILVDRKQIKNLDSNTKGESSSGSVLTSTRQVDPSKLIKLQENKNITSKEDWTICEDKEFLISFINQIEKDNIESYDLDNCNTKLDIIKELITIDMTDSQMSYLLSKMKQLCTRLRLLQD